MKKRTGVLGRKWLVVLMAAIVLGTMGTGFASALTPTVSKTLYQSGNSEVFLPRLTGLRNEKLQESLNATIMSTILAFATDRANASLHGDFEVLFNNGKLLTVRFFGDSMQAGAVHPNKIDRGVHLDLTTGKIYALSDLFYPDVDFAAKVIELCEKQQNENRLQIEGLWQGWRHEDFTDSWSGGGQFFVLGLSSMRVYSIPRYATGAISGYRVNYSDLLPMIDQNGSLWQNLRSNVIDKSRIQPNDKIAGLTVVSVDKGNGYLNDATFAGEIDLTGIIEWVESAGDGPGFLFRVGTPDNSKLPALGFEQEMRVIRIETNETDTLQLPRAKTKGRLVIDSFSIGERQIGMRAKGIKWSIL
jgi:hypothetical protein